MDVIIDLGNSVIDCSVASEEDGYKLLFHGNGTVIFTGLIKKELLIVVKRIEDALEEDD